MKRLIAGLTGATLIAACASAPVAKYEAATDLNSPGYVDAPAEKGRITVAYTGSKGMTKQQVAQYALLRAAELTSQAGQEWFAVIDTRTQKVELRNKKDDLDARSGGFVTGESTGTGAGGAGRTPGSTGTTDSSTRGGPSTGGFGGGDVPYQVLERWKPPMVPQTVIIIQMGKGAQARFDGLDKPPQIYDAKSVAAEIQGKMKQ